MWLMNHIFNPLVRIILKSPLHGMLSGSLTLLIYEGKKSGNRYELPVQYVQENNRIYIIPGDPEGKSWWRNFRDGGMEVKLVLNGKTQAGLAAVVDPDKDLAEAQKALEIYFHRFPGATRMHHVPVEADGSFKFDDLVRAAESTILVRVSLEN